LPEKTEIVPHRVHPAHRRDKRSRRVVKRFTGGEVPVFLISFKAGGTGLDP
jgi:hypothetical protein